MLRCGGAVGGAAGVLLGCWVGGGRGRVGGHGGPVWVGGLFGGVVG